MSLDSTIGIIANIALALSFIVALIFGMAQIRTAERDRKERFTLETLRSFSTREFAEQLFFIRGAELPPTQDEFFAMPKEEQVMLIQIAQQMESLGMMVYERYIDLDLVDKTLGSFVSTVWVKYKPMFTDMRATMPDPYLGEYFQWLAERIDKRMADEPRAPFYKVQPRRHKK
ncbi:MAG TPA: hypothetical protein VEW28_11180 [Candidatus Kapabacteria bacterium]|nr:hypothetical protein [Candidatus Kapabacteria bacterium]